MSRKQVKGTIWTPTYGQITQYHAKGYIDPTTQNKPEVLDALKRKHFKYIEQLTDPDKILIKQYLENSQNYKPGGKNFNDREHLYKIITNDELIIEQPFIVWRGHAREPTIAHMVGDILTYEHFSSTSTDFTVATGFLRGSSCCCYEISVKPGMRGLYVDNFVFFGRNEKEFLLPYGLNFEVIQIKKVGDQTVYILNVI
jgi:hypothetical protein